MNKTSIKSYNPDILFFILLYYFQCMTMQHISNVKLINSYAHLTNYLFTIITYHLNKKTYLKYLST
jgi:hypothetical protein